MAGFLWNLTAPAGTFRTKVGEIAAFLDGLVAP